MPHTAQTDREAEGSPERSAGLPLADLSIRHLQMPSGLTQSLEALGLGSIGALQTAIAAPDGEAHLAKTRIYMERLALAEGDWLRYWQLCGDRFHHLIATCPELRALPRHLRDTPLGRQNFGSAGARIARIGITTVGALIDGLERGLPEVSGLGQRKIQVFFFTLMELVVLLRSGARPLVFPDLARRLVRPLQPDLQGNGAWTSFAPANAGLPDEVAALPLRVLGLRLGRVSEDLRAGGVDTLGALAAALSGRMALPAGIGPLKLGVMRGALSVAARHVAPDGAFDLAGYCRSRRLRLLPEPAAPASAADLFLRVPDVLRSTVEAWGDPLLVRILQDRIMASVERRLPLSRISEEFGISRERVRQREASLIRLLERMFRHGEDACGAVVLRDEMVAVLALACRIVREDGARMNFHLLSHRLSDAVGADPEDVLPIAPALFRIIRGELPIRRNTGDLTAEDLRALESAPTIRDLPVTALQIGRLCGEIEGAGYARLGEMIDDMKSGKISRRDCAATRKAIDEIRDMAAFARPSPDGGRGMSPDSDAASGRFDLLAWSAWRNVPVLPEDEIADAGEFLDSLRPSIEVIAGRALGLSNAVGILRLRVFPPRSERLTMQACAEILGGMPTRVKSDETRLLRYLGKTLASGSDSLAHAHLRPSFVRFWAEIFGIARACGNDGELIVSHLVNAWQVDEARITREFPLIMAILTGYPYGRLTKTRRHKPLPSHRTGGGALQGLAASAVRARGAPGPDL